MRDCFSDHLMLVDEDKTVNHEDVALLTQLHCSRTVDEDTQQSRRG